MKRALSDVFLFGGLLTGLYGNYNIYKFVFQGTPTAIVKYNKTANRIAFLEYCSKNAELCNRRGISIDQNKAVIEKNELTDKLKDIERSQEYTQAREKANKNANDGWMGFYLTLFGGIMYYPIGVKMSRKYYDENGKPIPIDRLF